MTHKNISNCLKCSLLLNFLLICLTALPQERFAKVEGWMKDHLDALGGRAVMVVWKDGKTIYTHAENNISRKQQFISKMIAKRTGKDADEMTEDFDVNSKQMIASCSKWISAATIMSFVDDGSLKLTDTVGKFLPVLTANGKGNITIWQCLSHLTGIKTPGLKESISEIKSASSMDEAIAQIAAMPMEGEPGKTFHYSNAGLQIAAAVVEKISGKDFETLFIERIAKPCNMNKSDFGHAKVALPAGGARSTPNDYIQFLSMILNKGIYNGKKILSADAVAEMQKDRVTADCKIMGSPAEAGDWGYGFGEWVMNSRGLSATDSSLRNDAVTSPGLFGSFPWVDNKRGYAGFLFVFNVKNKGRHEMYSNLKKLVDEAVTNQ